MYLALPDEQFDQAVVFQLPAMVKARTVGGRKIIEVEASREVEDLEGDLITQAALLGSAASFIAKGHIDVDHYSELGSRVGIHDPWSWVIGRPTDVKVLPLGSTSVVADISTVPEKIWDSVQDRWVTLWSDLTANPPIPWYASVYGFPLPDGLQDCRGGRCPSGPRRFLVTKFDWRSLALTRRPVNSALTGNAVVLAKSLIPLLLKGTRERPTIVHSPADMAAVAGLARQPSEGQARAGNYQKGHAVVGGIDVTIENAMGSIRSGTSPDGSVWSVRMPCDYGYAKKTKGADGDHVDLYIGPEPHKAHLLPAFVIDQVDAATQKFDEHKPLIGFPDWESAERTYCAAFSDGRGSERIGFAASMPFEEFASWLEDGDTAMPIEAVTLKKDSAVVWPENMDDVWPPRECGKCMVHKFPSIPGFRSHFAKCMGWPPGPADMAAHAAMYRSHLEKFLSAI